MKQPVQKLLNLSEWTLKNFENQDRTVYNPSNLCKVVGGPVAVMSQWERLIEAQNIPEFVKFIEASGLKPEDVQGSIEGWEIFRCGDIYGQQNYLNIKTNGVEPGERELLVKGREIWLPSVMRVDDNGRSYPSLAKYNPYKSFFATKSAVSRTMRNLERLGLEIVYDITLTFPGEVSQRIADEGEDMMRRCEKVVKKFYSWLGKMIGGKIGACVNLHAWRSADTKPHVHAHGLLLGNYVKGKEITKDNVARILPAWFFGTNQRTGRREEGNLLRMIKRKWAEFVNKEFNLAYDRLDIHLEFIELRDMYGHEIDRGRARFMHKIKYNRRRPLCDLALYYLENKFKQEEYNPLWAGFLIGYKNRPLTLGYWNRMSRLAVLPLEDVKTGSARCPFCAKEMHYVRLYPHRELPSYVSRVAIDRKSNFYWLGGPPPT